MGVMYEKLPEIQIEGSALRVKNGRSYAEDQMSFPP
jgi:hypothetical protein